jgi:hypothetical protein
MTWGLYGSATDHERYMERVDHSSRRICGCGCGQRSTHRGMANGVCLMTGCELSVRRWVRDGFNRQALSGLKVPE